MMPESGLLVRSSGLMAELLYVINTYKQFLVLNLKQFVQERASGAYITLNSGCAETAHLARFLYSQGRLVSA